jgi:hypothetical protein
VCFPRLLLKAVVRHFLSGDGRHMILAAVGSIGAKGYRLMARTQLSIFAGKT